MVGPGTYYESVNVTAKTSLTILGPQAGKDARDRDGQTAEAIVDGSTTGNPPFTLCETTNVVIDGFTLQGGTVASGSCGVYTVVPAGLSKFETTETQVLNNIIHNNSAGVYSIAAAQEVLEHNLFKNNNAGSGLYVGYGIYTFEVSAEIVDENGFSGNEAAALVMLQADAVHITNNTSEKDGAFAVFYDATFSVFGHNQGKDFGARGVLPVYISWPSPSFTLSHKADAAVDIGPEVAFFTIADNDLEGGASPISNGIAFTTVFGFGPNPSSPATGAFLTVKDNQIERFPLNGIAEEAASFLSKTTGTLVYAQISGNRLEDNGNDGILIEYADPSTGTNFLNQLFSNDAHGNQVNDCEDDTAPYGTLTAETYNTWIVNVGNTSSPAGLCARRGW
jgi:hypothetical protein